MSRKIRVIVVDDSALVRSLLSEIINRQRDMECIGTANDPLVAREMIRELNPDVITLDVEMPKMDGLTFLQKIMGQHPIPMIICSSHTTLGSDLTVKALDYGAVDIITKPRIGTEAFLAESRILICDAVKAAARVRSDRLARRIYGRRPVQSAALHQT